MVHEMIDGSYRQTNLPDESAEYLKRREALRQARRARGSFLASGSSQTVRPSLGGVKEGGLPRERGGVGAVAELSRCNRQRERVGVVRAVDRHELGA